MKPNEQNENWCEIFKTGTFKDSKGETHTYTLDELEKMKSNYENVHNQVPICVGHPQTDSPAFGWFDKMKISPNKAGYSLLSTFKNVVPEFKEAVKRGLYKTRSLSHTPDYVIRHLAFLGGATPAIKGLEQFCFAGEDDNDIRIEYESAPEPSTDTDADKTEIHAQEPKSIKDAAASMDEFGGTQPKPPILDETAMQDELKLELEAKNNKITELEAKLKAKEIEETKKEFADWTDAMISEGRITPSQKNGVIDILTAFDNLNVNFSDDANNDESPKALFKKFISSIKQVEFNDVATDNRADTQYEPINFSDSEEILDGIRKIQKAYQDMGIELNSAEALQKLKERK